MAAKTLATPQYHARSLETLLALDALRPKEAALLKRIADIADATTISEDVLNILHEGAAAETLFPEEKRAREKLWHYLEWPELPQPQTPPGLAELSCRDISKVPEITDTPTTSVASLPRHLQKRAT